MVKKYCNGMVHLVKSGDTLYSISRMHQVPLAQLLRANPYVDVYNLLPGQEICVPIIKRNDEMSQMNPLEMEDTKEDYITYITDGETSLGDVLKEQGISMEEFMKNNDMNEILLAKDVVVYLPKKV